ncbi:MAG: hypothetical protein ACM3IJ_03865 [Candidatus Levyibacteriota bacterium]
MINLKAHTYFKVTKIIFFLVGLMHLFRLVFNWSMVVGGWEVPWYLSLVGVALPWYLAYSGFKLIKK